MNTQVEQFFDRAKKWKAISIKPNNPKQRKHKLKSIISIFWTEKESTTEKTPSGCFRVLLAA